MSQTHQITAKATHTHIKKKHIYIYIPRTCLSSIFEGQPYKTRPFSIKTRIIWVLGIYNNLLKIPSSRLCQPSSQEWFKGVVARTAPFGAFVTVTLEGGEQADGLVHVSKIKALLIRNDLEKKGVAIFFGVNHKKQQKKLEKQKVKEKKTPWKLLDETDRIFFLQEQVSRSRCWKRVGCEGCLSGLVVRGVRIGVF